MLEKLKALPLFIQLGLAALLLVGLFFVFNKFSLYYAHYKGWKSDQEYSTTIKKSEELEKQSAVLKAHADELEHLAEIKDSQILELTALSAKYGKDASNAAGKINDVYGQLAKDKEVINSSSTEELILRICQARKDLGFPSVGQCKGF